MKDMIKPVAVLAVICMIVTTVLACVNIITKPVIKAEEEKNAAQARAEVLSEAESFEKLEDIKLPEGVTEAYKGSGNTGYVIIMQTKGYGGDIKLICGINPDGSIESVKTLSHNETSGIGSKVADNRAAYRHQYEGKNADSYKDVDAVTGATVSSTAYKKAIGLAFRAFSAIKEAEK